MWTPPPGFEFKTTRTAYGFIARLKQHEGVASGLRINVQADGSGAWSELNFSDDLALRRRPHRADGRMVEGARRRRRSLHRGEARPLRDGTALPRPRRGNQAEYKRDDVEQ